VTCRALE
jgi:hypothetical protein